MPRQKFDPPAPFTLRWCETHSEVEGWDENWMGWFSLTVGLPVCRRLFENRHVIRQEVAALRARLGGEG